MNRITVSIALLAISIPAIAQEPGEFRHDLPDGARPWAHENFDAADDKFTFAVFSDLTGGERSGVFEIAVAQLSLLRPELILNVGDLINGGMADVIDAPLLLAVGGVGFVLVMFASWQMVSLRHIYTRGLTSVAAPAAD